MNLRLSSCHAGFALCALWLIPSSVSAQGLLGRPRGTPTVPTAQNKLGVRSAVAPIPFDEGLQQLGQDLGQHLKEASVDGQRRRVAVFPLRDLRTETTVLGKHIAERLTTSLFDPRSIGIIERTFLDQVLREQKLGESGALDAKTAQKVGELAGANVVVTGSLVNRGEFLAVDLRAIDCKSGEVVGVARANLLWDEALRELGGETIVQTSGTATAPGSTNIKTPQGAKSLILEDDFWKFEIKSATLDRGQITVELIVQNQGKQEQFLWAEKVFVDQGAEFASLVSQDGGTWSASKKCSLVDQAVVTKAVFPMFQSLQNKKNKYLPNAKQIQTLVFTTDQSEVPRSVTLHMYVSGWDSDWENAAKNFGLGQFRFRPIQFTFSDIPVTPVAAGKRK